ncbi:MAG: hypothetical protein K6B75_03190 [Lachnospiraceae bacterium]|nr:hypothetical protein [Lachnospiraceae bacterium]
MKIKSNRYMDELRDIADIEDLLWDEDKEEDDPEKEDESSEEEEEDLPEDPAEAIDGPKTVKELITGIVFFFTIFQFAHIFVKGHASYLAGTFIGGTLASLLVINMHHSLENALLYDSQTATRKMRVSTIFRMFAMVAVMVVTLHFGDVYSFAGTLLGLLSLKFSAYLQPLTHKVLQKTIFKGR